MLDALGHVPLVLAFALGLRHALEPDHLAAVATLVRGADSSRASFRLGAVWGLGHALALLAVAGLAASLELILPEGLMRVLEASVGLMLVALGGRACVAAWREGKAGFAPLHTHATGTRHDHAGPERHLHVGGVTLALRPLLVGLLHGSAGSGALAVLAVSASGDAMGRLLWVAVFGGGALVAMGLATTLARVPFAALAARPRALSALSGATGLVTVALGVAWSLKHLSAP